MDLTTDFQSQQDNTARRSLSRRVSFAAHCRVRLFQNPNHDNTNSTGTPPSSSPTPPSDAAPSQQEEPQFNDENDYPGARSNGRRSSVRYSVGPAEADMDLTSVGPVLGQADLDGSAIMDEEFEGGSMDDMDGTDIIDNALRRRRSSVATGLSMPPLDEGDVSRTDSEDMERSREDGMEFTIPINRSLRPAQQDDAWLALRRMTHSGSENAQEDTEMSEQSISFDAGARADSFQDNDTSHDLNDGDHTINISKVLGWPSQAEDNSQINVGEESNMEESDVYGPAAPAPGPPPQPLATTEPQSQHYPAQEEDTHRPEQSLVTSQPSVFQPPSADALSRSQSKNNKATQDAIPLSDSRPFTFTAPQPVNTRSISPSKIPLFKPTFTAAFAPPVSKQSPKKREAGPSRSTLPGKRPRPDDDEASPSKSTMPSKRPRPDDDGSTGEANMSIDLPSPAKRQAMANRWPRGTPTHTQASPAKASPRPRPLSPSKRTPFQRSLASTSSTTRTTSLRRPSGYFARRKSLAVGSSSQPVNRETGLGNSQAEAGIKTGLGFRRASVGSGSEDAWQRFDKDNLPAQGSQSVTQPPNEDGTVNPRADDPPTTPPRPSAQSPASSQLETQTRRPRVTPTSPPRTTEPFVSVDLSNILQSTAEDDDEREPTTVNDADQGDDTEHWRDNLDTGNPGDEQTVRLVRRLYSSLHSLLFRIAKYINRAVLRHDWDQIHG